MNTPLIRTVIGTWAIVTLYAILHDQVIVWFAPEHFTVGHPAVPGVSSPPLQAAILAFVAALPPGLAFGTVLGLAANEGPWPTVSDRTALGRVLLTVALTELVAWGLGALTWSRGWLVFGASWYPDWATRSTQTTQTVQLAAYVAGAGFAGLAVGITLLRRCLVGRRRVDRIGGPG